MLCFVAGCSEKVSSFEPNNSASRHICDISTGNGDGTTHVYVVTVDGADYIMMVGYYKCAICPKTEKK